MSRTRLLAVPPQPVRPARHSIRSPHQALLKNDAPRASARSKAYVLTNADLRFARSLKCANCGTAVDRPSAYCGYLCKQKAAAIRYGRAKLQEGIFWRFDILDAIYTKVISISNGGYDVKARFLKPMIRKAVHDRSNSMCERCGKPGTEIHHARRGSNALGHLQLLCKDCHDDRHGRSLGYAVAGPDVPPEERMSRMELEAHFLEHLSSHAWGEEYIKAIFRKRPLRKCYDHETWKQLEQAMRKERTEVFARRRHVAV
jgi:hypothetical protein